MSDYVITDLRIATMRNETTPYGMVDDGTIAVTGEKIAWAGSKHELPQQYRDLPIHSGKRCLATPGLIDCHTHLVFGGHRAQEFELRLQGASYEEIARAGGGIVSTVTATRHASEDELLGQALPRVDALLAEGVTTLEIKSGYGLDVETELRMLRAARRIGDVRPVTVKTTFLGAHAIPPEYKGQSGTYIRDICIPALKAAAAEGLVDAVDGFCEGIAFSVAEMEQVFQCASALDLPVKLHAEQLSNLGGAILAARYQGLSADHLEYVDEDGVSAMKEAAMVAVILPGAFYTLREKKLPPIDMFRGYGVPLAISTDCNPGSSPMTSLLLAMNMGCTLFRMTPEEVLQGVTRHAAQALGLKDRGIIAAGQRADLALWQVEHPAELAYRIGFNPLHKRIFGGQW